MKRFSLFLLAIFFVYLLTVLFYPLSNDEAIFSVIGKNLGHLTLYNDLPDDKPPAIFLTTFLLSKIPLNLFFLNRILVFLVVLSTAFLTMKLSNSLFKSRDSTGLRPVVTKVMPGTVEFLSVNVRNDASFLSMLRTLRRSKQNKPPASDWWFLTQKNNYLFSIPLFFILSSVIYLAGIIPLTETFEMFFVMLSIYFLINSRKNEYETKGLLLSSLMLFLAFQYKQTAVMFLVFPVALLVYEKRIRKLFLFLLSFLVCFSILLLALNYFGLFDFYFQQTFLYHFDKIGTLSPPLFSRLLFFLLPLPIILIALPGILISLKNKLIDKKDRIVLNAFLLTSIAVLLSSLFLIRAFTFRFYFYELVPFLAVFIPLTIEYFSKSSLIQRILAIFSVIFLFLIYLIVFSKIFAVNSSVTNLSEINYISSMTKNYPCENIFATVNYWYATGDYSKYLKYTLNAMGPKYTGFTDDDFKKELSKNGTCFVNTQSYSFYSLEKKLSSEDHMFSITKELCTCEYFGQKTMYSAICYDCNS